jgi:four helix bundle protein
MAHASFRDLTVWQQSMLLVEEIYALSASFPRDERFGLTAQLRRAAVSVPSNIAEGKRRKHQRAQLNHLDIALGSQAEVEVHLELAKRLGFGDIAHYPRIENRVEQVGRMLNGLIASLRPKGWPGGWEE